MKSSRYALFLSAVFLFGSQQLFAAAIDELSAEDQAKLKSGEQVAVFTKSDMADAPWPVCDVYQWVNASPEEVTAMFTDYDLQMTYVPMLAKSVSRATDRATVKFVDYTMNLPMGFGAENYTAEDTLEMYDSGSSYKISWTVAPTASIKHSEGNARFEPLETPAGKGTLIAYHNFIFPIRWGVTLGWVVERSKKQVQDTVTAIAGQIVKEKASDPELLNKQIQTLRDTLAQ